MTFDIDKEKIRDRMQECDKYVLCDDYWNEAEKSYKNANYRNALDKYSELANLCLEKRQLAQQKINDCKEKMKQVNYNHYIKVADQYFNERYFKNALNAYEDALEFYPEDIYCKQRIKECTMNDPQIIKRHINEAVIIAEKSRKNWAEALGIMYQYENTGLLDANNYHFMSMVLLNNYNKVRLYMGFTDLESMCLAKKYCELAIDQGHSEAKRMWYDTFFRTKINCY